MKLWHKILAAIILVLVGYSVLYMYSLSKVEIKAAGFDNITGISLEGFTMNGYVEANNKGIVPVSIDHIDYDVTLESTGTVITSGSIKGKTLPPGQIVKFLVAGNITWIPTAEAAASMLLKKETDAVVKGTAHARFLYFFTIRLPFEKTIDLNEYVMQFVMKGIGDLIDSVTGQ